MNLFDIVRRPDRTLVIDTGTIEPISRSGFVGARLSPKGRIRLLGASEFACLSTFPRDLGWRLPAASPNFELSAVNARDSKVLYRSSSQGGASAVVPDWPTWASDGFDLELTNHGDDPLEIVTGTSFNPRLAVASLIRGKGIEVGPGANPFVKNSEGTEVKYFEAYSAEDLAADVSQGERKGGLHSVYNWRCPPYCRVR
jgi:hypothetical protein